MSDPVFKFSLTFLCPNILQIIMINNELITVIVPVYNVEGYVERCINSICNQTYQNMEILIIDDGSIDRSGLICDQYAKIDKRILVIHKNNEGLSAARNEGIENANGQYIAFVDGDDYIDPAMLEELYNAIIQNNGEISICGRNIIGNDGKRIKTLFTLDNEIIYSGKEGIRHILLLDTCDVAVWDKLYKKELFDNLRFPANVRMSEDYCVTPKAMSFARRIVHIGKPLYNYVQRDGSITRDPLTERRIQVIEQVREMDGYISSIYDDMDKELDYFWGVNLQSIQSYALRNKNSDMIKGMLEVYRICMMEKNRILGCSYFSYIEKIKYMTKNFLLRIRVSIMLGDI